jgi:hypothetical protein
MVGVHHIGGEIAGHPYKGHDLQTIGGQDTPQGGLATHRLEVRDKGG